MNGVVGEVGRCLDTICCLAVTEIPCVGRDGPIVKAGPGVEIALGCCTVEGEERLWGGVAEVANTCKDCKVWCEHRGFSASRNSVRVEDVSEIAANKQPRWA